MRTALSIVFALMPTLAFAHVGVGDTHGATHGFLHPLTGIDHILAMVGVGMFAAHRGGRAIALLPLSFLSMMAAGGVFGMLGVPLPFVEIGIGLSVVVIGLMIAFDVRLPVYLATAVVGLFALFHGHAHGAEMPETVSGLAYGLGFVGSTGLLCLAGVGIGVALKSFDRPRFPPPSKVIGGAMALVGVGLLAGAF